MSVVDPLRHDGPRCARGGRPLAATATLVSGFVLDGCFYDREAAARKVAEAA